MGSLMEIRREIITNTPHKETLAGDLINFTTDMSAPMQISGIGSILRTGYNIYNENLTLGILNTNGTVSSSTARLVSDLIPVVPNKTYVYSNARTSTTFRGRAAFYDAEGTLIKYSADFPDTETQIGTRYFGTFTTPVNARYLRFCTNTRYGTQNKNDISICYPSTEYNYHPYEGEIYTANTKSLIGVNNLWSDSGNISVTYWTH